MHKKGVVLENNNFLLVELGAASKVWIVERILKLGVNIYLAQKERYAELETVLPAENIIYVDTYSIHHLIPAVVRFLDEKGIEFDGVGTFFEHAVPNAALVAQLLGLSSINPAVSFRTSNCKIAMRYLLAKADANAIKYSYLSELPNLIGTLAASTPLVLKPVVGNNSYGTVYLSCAEDAQIDTFLTRTMDSSVEPIFSKTSHGFLLEEYVEGLQLTVDGYVYRGQCHIFGVTQVEHTAPPFFVQHTNLIPPHIPEAMVKKCECYTKEVVAFLKLDHCFFHCELKIKDGQPKLIEIACRLAGGKIVEGYEKAYGYDLIKANLQLWFGDKPELDKSRNRYVVQSGIFPDGPGRVESIHRPDGDELDAALWVYEVVTPEGHDVVTFPDYPVPIIYYALACETLGQVKYYHKVMNNGVIINIT